LFDSRIFLLLLLFIWKIIIFLKYRILYILFCAISVLIVLKSRANVTIFVAFILYSLFIFCFSFIYTIIFIFFVEYFIEDIWKTFMQFFARFVKNRFFAIVIYIILSCILFFVFSLFFSLSIVLFSFFKIETISMRIFFAKILSSCRVSFFVKKNYFVSVFNKIVLNAFFFLDL